MFNQVRETCKMHNLRSPVLGRVETIVGWNYATRFLFSPMLNSESWHLCSNSGQWASIPSTRLNETPAVSTLAFIRYLFAEKLLRLLWCQYSATAVCCWMYWQDAASYRYPELISFLHYHIYIPLSNMTFLSLQTRMGSIVNQPTMSVHHHSVTVAVARTEAMS